MSYSKDVGVSTFESGEAVEPAVENFVGQTSVGACCRACSVIANAEFARPYSLLDVIILAIDEVLYVDKFKTVALAEVYLETFCAVS